MKVKSLGHVQLLVTPWTAAHQAPPSMGFFRQEYWSGVPLLSPVLNKTGTEQTRKEKYRVSRISFCKQVQCPAEARRGAVLVLMESEPEF